MKKKLWIEGMTCPRCLRHLESALSAAGLSVLDTDLGQGVLVVESEKMPAAAALRELVEEAGYDLTREEALDP